MVAAAIEVENASVLRLNHSSWKKLSLSDWNQL